jgi:hypothetical protein
MMAAVPVTAMMTSAMRTSGSSQEFFKKSHNSLRI